MKHISAVGFFFIGVCLCATGTQAQGKMEPAVLFLYPHQISMDDSASAVLSAYLQEQQITDELRQRYIPDNLAPNWKTIREYELKFIEQQDFPTILVVKLSRELTYRENDYHDVPLIYPVKETAAAENTRYKRLADAHGMSWLVNFPTIRLWQEGSIKKIAITVQLYNVMTNRLFVDHTYTADSSTLDVCDDDAWYCMAEKLKPVMMKDLADSIEKNRHRHK